LSTQPVSQSGARLNSKPDPQPAAAQHGLQGIALLLSAVLIFATMDTTAKYLSRSYSVPMLMWARYFIHLVFMLLVFAPRLGAGVARTRRLGLQVLRALMLVLCTAFFFAALRVMPIAETTAIGFVSPFLVTLLSGPLLGERIDRRQWMAVAAGFAGVLIVVRPGGGLLSTAVLLPLCAALCYSLYQILTRKLAASENPVVTLFYTALVGALVASAMLPWFWIAPQPSHWGLLLLLGGGGAVGHYILIKAFERTAASVLAPFGYTQIVWVTALGYLVFGDFPDAVSLFGMAVIVSCGLYCAYVARSRMTADTATVIVE
jgi:drug/metabolite transporter (DMT)-like permease